MYEFLWALSEEEQFYRAWVASIDPLGVRTKYTSSNLHCHLLVITFQCSHLQAYSICFLILNKFTSSLILAYCFSSLAGSGWSVRVYVCSTRRLGLSGFQQSPSWHVNFQYCHTMMWCQSMIYRILYDCSSNDHEVTGITGCGHKWNILYLCVHNLLALTSLPPMTTSSKSTDGSLHPYDAVLNHQDFDSMISDAKVTADTRTNFYNHRTSRRYALVRVACSSIFGCTCIVAGIVTLVHCGVFRVILTNLSESLHTNHYNSLLPLQGEILALVLNIIIMLCTESIGLIHSISLCSALASESQLCFNTNLCLLTAACGWYNPNGTLFNGISAILLIVSYSSASLILCVDNQITPQMLVGSFIAFAHQEKLQIIRVIVVAI
jgi:hypothetical protein